MFLDLSQLGFSLIYSIIVFQFQGRSLKKSIHDQFRKGGDLITNDQPVGGDGVFLTSFDGPEGRKL